MFPPEIIKIYYEITNNSTISEHETELVVLLSKDSKFIFDINLLQLTSTSFLLMHMIKKAYL